MILFVFPPLDLLADRIGPNKTGLLICRIALQTAARFVPMLTIRRGLIKAKLHL